MEQMKKSMIISYSIKANRKYAGIIHSIEGGRRNKNKEGDNLTVDNMKDETPIAKFRMKEKESIFSGPKNNKQKRTIAPAYP